MRALRMAPATPIPIDALLRHSSGLRALARGLLRDEHAAEEVVQDTWLAAFEAPPARGGALGGWLARVTRKKAQKRRRGDEHRREREERAARPEAQRPTDELAAERELLRLVVDAVLELAEPYQGVVLMRYFQDLAPREIAQRRGAPVDTVNSQLQRALAQLRTRLDHAQHDAEAGHERERWALLLASATGETRPPILPPEPAPRATPASRAGELARRTSEVIAMHWKLSIGLTSALLGGLGYVTQVGLQPPEAEEARSEAAAMTATPAAVALATQDPRADEPTETTPGRVALGAAASEGESDQAEPGPREFLLEIIVVDEHDQPRTGVGVFAAPPEHPLNLVGATGAGGRLRAIWPATAPATSLVLGIAHGNTTAGGLRRVELRADELATLRLTLRGHAPRALARTAKPLTSLGYTAAEAGDAGEQQPAALAPAIPVVSWPDGTLRFHWPVPVEPLESEEFVELIGEVAHSSGGYPPLGEGTFELLRGLGYVSSNAPAAPVRKVTLSGIVLDARGNPAQGARVGARSGDSVRGVHNAGSQTTDPSGAFSLVLVAGASLEADAGGGDFGIASASFELDPDSQHQRITWNPKLDRGLEVRGTLRGPGDAQLDGWLVVFEAGPDAKLWQKATVCSAGRFAIPNLPPRAGRLLLFERPDHAFPRRVVAGVLPGGAEVELTLEERELERGSAGLRLTGADGQVLEDAESFLWQLESGRGAPLRYYPDAEGQRSGPIPLGRYRATAGTKVNGFHDLGQIEVVAGEEQSLGVIALPAPGVLELSPELLQVYEEGLYLLTRAMGGSESIMLFDSLSAPGPIALPAGDYLLRLTDLRQGAEQRFTTRIAAGETTLLDAEPR